MVIASGVFERFIVARVRNVPVIFVVLTEVLQRKVHFEISRFHDDIYAISILGIEVILLRIDSYVRIYVVYITTVATTTFIIISIS